MSQRPPQKSKKDKAKERAEAAPPPPWAMLQIADSYWAAALKMRSERGNTDFVSISIVLDAFAFELYLKALYVATERQIWPDNVHNLHALFLKLRKPLRDQIASGWAAVLQRDRPAWVADTAKTAGVSQQEAESYFPHQTAADFESELAQGRNMFVTWRYCFEPGKKGVGTLGPAVPTLRALINQHLTEAEKLSLQARIAVTRGFAVKAPKR